ncbi:MAG: Sir2 family NAD+-dependent deacetylase [Pseudomonadota bacterium]
MPDPVIPAPGGAIVVLTGAGISKESGLDTFRDAGGIWARVRIEDVATPEAFAREPARVHAFYNARRRALLGPEVAPNAAHAALSRLEAEWSGPVLVVTQNIDNLHERAGTRNLRHLHGELLKSRCTSCGDVTPQATDLDTASVCRACGAASALRPHVVWFGELPFDLDEISGRLSRCALFVAIGTSGNVYPAAGFVDEARSACAHTVELNLEPSAGHSLFAERIYGEAGRIVPQWVERMIGGRR